MKVRKEVNWVLSSLISGRICHCGEGLMDSFWKYCSETEQAFLQHEISSKNREKVIAG